MLNYIYIYKKIYKNKEIRFYLLEDTFRKKNKTNQINYGKLYMYKTKEQT